MGSWSVTASEHHRRCHVDPRAQFDQELGRQARPRDAPDQEGKPVLLRHEGPTLAWMRNLA